MLMFVSGTINAQSKFKSRQDSLEYEAAKTEVWSPVPKSVQPGASFSDAPSDAIILYNGKNLDAFQKRKGGMPGWKIEADGALTVVKGSGDLETKEAFGDCQFHLEFREPSVIAGSNQTRGNSGIWFMSNYEMQILDNYNNPTYVNGMVGSLYKQHVPLVAAGRKPGEWQTYDITLVGRRVTVVANGKAIILDQIIPGITGGALNSKEGEPGPIMLQGDHGPVEYRNIILTPAK